jgi:endo-1,4-beta-xylanase
MIVFGMVQFSYRLFLSILFLFSSVFLANADHGDEPLGLKDAFKAKFHFGTALNLSQIQGRNSAALNVIKQHFNSVVAENCMKSMFLQPREGEFYFDDADRFVALGETQQMNIIGHTLIWHSQAPKWFFVDQHGNDVSREVLIERMKTHITTVVSRYKGRIKGWDVVNEAILDDGTLRQSKFYKIIGKDYIRLAFEFAHAADPEAELYYNDYSMALERKRNGVIRMVRKLQQDGVKIDAIGMQGHITLDFPKIEEFEKSILAFSALGTQVMVTELDLTVLPTPKEDRGAEVSTNYAYREAMNPYVNGLPEAKQKQFDLRYAAS